MSMLLDALRKSEARARQVSLVDRLVEVQPAGPDEHPGIMGWPWLAGLLVPVFGLVLWLNWLQHGQPRHVEPAASVQASVGPSVAGQESAAPASGPGASAAAPVSASAPPTSEASVSASQADASQSGAAEPAVKPGPSSPVAVLEETPAAPSDSAVPTAGQQADDASDTPASLPVPATVMLESAKPPPVLPAAPAASQATAAAIAEPTPATAQPLAGTSAVTGASPAAVEPIGYWQLPAAVRGSLPELHIRVLVYSDNPADRFLILNGQRMVEGDQGPGELRLQEVRRDGGLFAYRAYRFLLQQ